MTGVGSSEPREIEGIGIPDRSLLEELMRPLDESFLERTFERVQTEHHLLTPSHVLQRSESARRRTRRRRGPSRIGSAAVAGVAAVAALLMVGVRFPPSLENHAYRLEVEGGWHLRRGFAQPDVELDVGAPVTVIARPEHRRSDAPSGRLYLKVGGVWVAPALKTQRSDEGVLRFKTRIPSGVSEALPIAVVLGRDAELPNEVPDWLDQPERVPESLVLHRALLEP